MDRNDNMSAAKMAADNARAAAEAAAVPLTELADLLAASEGRHMTDEELAKMVGVGGAANRMLHPVLVMLEGLRQFSEELVIAGLVRDNRAGVLAAKELGIEVRDGVVVRSKFDPRTVAALNAAVATIRGRGLGRPGAGGAKVKDPFKKGGE